MAKFEKGDEVICISTQQKGIIVDVKPLHRGKQFYDVMLLKSQEKQTLAEQKLMKGIDLDDPFEKVKQGMYSPYNNFLLATTIFKINNSSLSSISTLKSSKTLFRPYQFKPLLKFLNSGNRRLLVADEVGLGKTIEAGHILLELKARRELSSCLIVCPKSLQIKWRDELEEKFNFKFKIYESMQDLISDFKAHSSVYGIINYEKTRPPRKPKDEKKNPKESLSDFLLSTGRQMDLMVCDEAHRLRNATTETHKGMKELMKSTKAAIFLTATPIMISRENLFNLLNLLDENEYSNYQIFENALRVNEPFIRALNQINNRVPFNEIADQLEETTVMTYTVINDIYFPEELTISEKFKDIPIYQEVITMLRGGVEDDETRVKLQFNISSLSKMNTIFSRTRKREVTQDFSQAERHPQTHYINLHPTEREHFERVINEDITDGEYEEEFYCGLSRSDSFSQINKKRQVASSVYAYLNELDDLMQGLDRYADEPDAKIEDLKKIIDKVVVKNGKKLIVFALFHKTLYYLKIRLEKLGYKTLVMHGQVKERDKILQEFKTSSDKNILLTSEVGGEGLDMQFTNALVNYDLPWNPMVVEQRIGRIDRFGQKSPVVNIYNLVVADSIQESIYQRLLDRIGIFKNSIGDIEAILDSELESNTLGKTNLRSYFNSLEKELYTNQLSYEERLKKLDDIAMAIITEQKHAQEMTNELNNTLTNDIFFQNEINKILNRKLYITEKELLAFIRQLIELRLPTCRLTPVDEKKFIYKLTLPKSESKMLTNFLSEYQPNDLDLNLECQHFRNSLRDETEIMMTFCQETAYDDKSLLFINAYHPLILTALEYFRRNTKAMNENTFKYVLNNDLLPKGDYFLAVYELKHKQLKFGKEQHSKMLFPVIYDLQNEEVIEDKELSKTVWGEAQCNAEIQTNTKKCDSQAIEIMKMYLGEAIDTFDLEILREQSQRMESVKLLDFQRTEDYYNSRLKRQQEVIDRLEETIDYSYNDEEVAKSKKVLPAQRGILSSIQEEFKKEKERVMNMTTTRELPKLQSLSLITIV